MVACVNSPSNVTVSGDLDAIDELQGMLDEDGVFGRKLKVDTAYHSHHMLMAMDGYLDKLSAMKTNQGQLTNVMFISSVTGKRILDGKKLGPSYSVKNAVQPVLFSDALEQLCHGGAPNEEQGVQQFVDILLEIGPHGALASPVRQILQSPSLKEMKISYASCLMRKQNRVRNRASISHPDAVPSSHVGILQLLLCRGSNCEREPG